MRAQAGARDGPSLTLTRAAARLRPERRLLSTGPGIGIAGGNATSCPRCGGKVFATERDYLCEKSQAETKPCKFRVSRSILQRELTPEEFAGTKLAEHKLALAITPYFFNLIDPADENCPIRRQMIPRVEETHTAAWEMSDPCGEDSHSPVPGLVHRYPDRVLFLVTDRCASYCRYCTRSRLVSNATGYDFDTEFDKQIAYIAAQRTREIGIRIALGAQSGDVRRLFLRHGLMLTAAGIAFGVAASLAVTRVLSALLFGVGPIDPVTYALVSSGLAAVALLATWLPARRASRVNPVAALRADA